MMKLFVRIALVDMNGYNGREHHPTREMEGSFVRVTNVDTVPAEELSEGTVESYQVFCGVLVDANGDDLPGGEVELIDHELSCVGDIIQTFVIA